MVFGSCFNDLSISTGVPSRRTDGSFKSRPVLPNFWQRSGHGLAPAHTYRTHNIRVPHASVSLTVPQAPRDV
jgi:hypothetical protein